VFEAESQQINPGGKKIHHPSLQRAASELHSRKKLKEIGSLATWSHPDQSKLVSNRRNNIIKWNVHSLLDLIP